MFKLDKCFKQSQKNYKLEQSNYYIFFLVQNNYYILLAKNNNDYINKIE